MIKKILMTGITGYLGSQMAKALLARGYSVIALKRKTSSLTRIESILAEITLYDLEENDFSELFRAHPQINTVIHTATCYGRNNETASQVARANTLFPLNLLEASMSAGVKNFVNTDTALDKSLNLYSLSKKQFMEWGKYYSLKNEVRFVNIRLEHFYGPGDDDSKFTTYVIKSCLNNVPKLKLTHGEQRRDFIYIDDVISAYLVLLKNIDVFPDGFEEFDVGSGEVVSIKDFVRTVHRLTESQSILDFGAIPYREGEVMLSEVNVEPLAELGWACNTTLEQGLTLTLKGVNS
jgi:CDP-paratose synthetase